MNYGIRGSPLNNHSDNWFGQILSMDAKSGVWKIDMRGHSCAFKVTLIWYIWVIY